MPKGRKKNPDLHKEQNGCEIELRRRINCVNPPLLFNPQCKLYKELRLLGK